MSAVAPAAADLPRRMRVAVKAADPATAKRLGALVAAAGHEVVAAVDAADAVLTDGSAEPLPGAPIVSLATIDGDYAASLPSEAGAAQVDAALRAVAAGLIVRVPPSSNPRFAPLPDDVPDRSRRGPGPAQVDAALRAVAAGLIVRVPPSPKSRFGPLPDDASPVLTPREIEVLTALGEGLSNKTAARCLGISPHTVKFHIEQLFRKLGANSRAEAVAKGLRRQIVEF